MKKQITQQNTTEIFNLNCSIKRQIFTGAALLFIFMLLSGASFAQSVFTDQFTLTDIRDAYTDNTVPTSNFGSNTSLKVSYTTTTQGQTTIQNFQRSFIEFDRTSLPTNLSTNDIVRATLKLYVNKVNAPASNGVYVRPVCNTFNESTVTWNTEPFCPGFFIPTATSQAITTANQYVKIDVKSVITDLLSRGVPTFTFIIYTNTVGGNIAFDGKESGGNVPILELELLKISSITGTDGLTGGGNNGNLFLSIANGGVTTAKIADGAVSSQKIANGAVGNAQLANNSVNTNNIVPGAVNNLQLADNSVTSNKISSGAITANQLSNGSVTETKLANNSVTNNKLTDNSVTTSKISQDAVTTNQLANNSVTDSKLADNSVTGNKIADGSVTETKLADGSVTNVKIVDGAINSAKIAPNSVGTNQIANGAVGNNQLGANSVTSDKIASGQVVRNVNGITDSVNLVAGDNVTITPAGNTLTISATGGSQTPPTPTYNSQQLALKRWYSANQSGASVTVGGSPYGVAFDGSSLWVSNAGNNTVSKIRASDGTILGTFPVGSNPRLVEFDGANIWVANFGSNTVTKLSASDGTVLATITVGNNPWGLAFDGTNIWVACYGSDAVYKLRPSNGTILGTVAVNNPLGLAFDGTNIWAVNNLGGGQVTKISGTGTPTVMGSFSTLDGFPFFIAFDGTHIWVVNSGGSLSKFRTSDGANLGLFGNGAGSGIAFDGANLWIAGESKLIKLRVSDNTIIGEFPISLGAGVAFDGANIWVANSGAGTVTKH